MPSYGFEIFSNAEPLKKLSFSFFKVVSKGLWRYYLSIFKTSCTENNTPGFVALSDFIFIVSPQNNYKTTPVV